MNDWSNVIGRPERFDFNSDPSRGGDKNTAAIAAGAMGHAMGAVDYDVNYTGDIVIRASGNVRR